MWGFLMPRLTALSVRNAKPGRHGDGDGLFLVVKPGGAKSWVLRQQVRGERFDMGLGSVDTSSDTASSVEVMSGVPLMQRRHLRLAEAREKAKILRALGKAGKGKEQIRAERDRERERDQIPLFSKAAAECHQALRSGWSEKGAKTFIKSLENHAFASIGSKRVDEITAADISNVLAPIWTAKPDMGRKVRQRIGTVLNFAHGKGWRPTEAPGRSVTVGLPRQPKGGNYAAMPFVDVPAFVARLAAEFPTAGRTALLFLIFTAARPGEVRGARWEQLDLDARDWNRPSDLMKGNDAPAHTVTLNKPAIDLLKAVKGERKPKPNDLIFPGQRGGRLSDMTMNKVLRSASLPFDAHAFRSSFRDWAAEKMPHIPDPVAEAALAHIVPDRVMRAYKRTTYLEMRRELLEAWGGFVTKVQQ